MDTVGTAVVEIMNKFKWTRIGVFSYDYGK